jgi:tetratricopeptide (TPR) repeat protein
MKVKPVFVYLGVFIVFIAAVIFFSNTTKNSNTPSAINPQAKMPDDDIHGKMKSQGNGDSPNKSNVMKEAVDKINNLKAGVEKNPNDTLKAREYADVLIAHKPDEAIKLYERILKADPKRVDILLQLTFVYFNQGNIDKAEEYNSKVLMIDKNNLFAQYNLGGLAQARGNDKKAASIWQELAKKYPQTEIGRMAGEVAKQVGQKTSSTK